MKKRILTLVLLLVAVIFAAEANPIDMRTAREVAMKFMNANSEVPLCSTDDLRLVKTYNISRGDAAFYIFNTLNGFVIVSADDCATPILGYSNERRFDVEHISIQLQDYLQSFVEQIEYGIENHLEADETRAQQWEMVRTTGRMTNNRTDEAVGPLLTTTWDQDSPYNLFVPTHCLTGCVATAMAQVMKYWEWPVQGTGEHSYQWNSQTLSANFGETTYDWANMLDSYNGQATQEQREAVALLMYHCGVSVNMHYGYAVSTASLNTSSLINYFNYSDEMSFECRDYYSDASWKAKLKDCLDLGRPLYYDGQPSSGTGQVGHAFVCDGYDNNDLFHFNMGWGGGGDFYALDAVYYNLHNCAVFNIHPQSNEPTVYEINVSVNNDAYGAASGGGTFIHGDTVTLSATADAGYCFQYWVENGGVASTNPNYSFPANFNRNLTAVFTGPVTISVSALEGGTVSGGGIYCYEECEVIATPDEGFEFAYWSVNDNVVSIDADYIFVVTGETHLTAHFVVEENIDFADATVKAICLDKWDHNGDGELSLAEAAGVTSIGLAFKNNSNITSFDELQYFTNLTSISENAFYSCSGLTSIILPDAVTSIDNYAFSGCTGLISLNIPSSVTLIGDYAFRNCRGLTSLSLPNALTSIGCYAFYGCNGLTGSLTIPSSITMIDYYAFYGCSGLTSLILPNAITSIGTYAFYGCSGLTSLILPNTVTSIGTYAFCGCSGLTSLILPNTVTSIGTYAFSGCSGLTSLTLPNTITSISASAFRGCSGLTSLTIPDSIASIGNYAFYSCSGLATLSLPASVVSIGSYAFNECSGLASIIVLAETPPTIEYNTFPYAISDILLYVPCQSVGAYRSSNNWRSFSNIIGLCTPGTITLVSDQPENGEVSGTGTYESGTFCTVTATPSEGYCFVNWTENGNVVSTDVSYSFVVTGDRLLTAHFAMDGIIVFADANAKAICLDNWDANSDGELSYAEAARVTNIVRIFKGHTEITSFDELQHFVNLSYLSSNAFSGCSGLTLVTLPSALTTIGDYAFCNCSGLISLPITNSITTIGKYVFSGCTALTSLTLPDSIISIGDYAFSGCTGFTGDLTIPNSVTSIGNYAFSDCNGFTGNLTIGNAVTSIGNYAFSGCSGITGDLHIPNSVISIGNYAFNGCNGFRGNLTIGDAVTSIGNYAFNNCYGFTGDLNIPNSVSSIGNYAFSGCHGFKGTLTLGDSVYSIGNYAFYYCYGFTGDLNIPNSVRYIRDYAFRGCNGFKGYLTIGNSVISIGNYAFENCYGFTGDLTIPNSVTSIGNYAFHVCTGFKGNLTIGTSVITIGDSAFSLCQNIKGSLTIPNSVTSIGEYAFGGINGLWGSLTIGSSVTSIGRSAFSGDSDLRSIIILACQPPTIGTNAFYNLTSNIPLYVPCESVEAYQSAAVWDAFTNIIGMCSPVTVSVVAYPVEGGTVSGAGMYESGTSCTVTATPNEGYCFASWMEYGNMSSHDPIYSFIVTEENVLTACFVPAANIVFADDTVKALCVQNWDTNGDGELSYHEAAMVTSLGYVFNDNTEISSFDELQYFISLSSINSYAFYNCYNLRSLIIPNTVTLIGEHAFYGCGLTGSLTIPDSVISIGYGAFEYCSGLTGSLTIGNAVTSIDSYAFYGCGSLTSLIIGNSVTSIGSYAFYGCGGLTSLVIGNSVTSIGNYAFSYCYRLNSMHVLTETPPTLESNAFYQVSTNIPVYVPCESAEAYQSAAIWDAFSNVIGMCSSGTVSVAADPVEGGTVSGAGTYEGGTFCSVIATPNEGYCFAYWTRNGSVVSYNSNFTFIVTEESVLTAHFVSNGNIVFADANVKAICVENWDVNGDGELSYLEAAWVSSIGQVFSYNEEITSFDELQYFIGLSSIDDYAFNYCYNLTSLAIPNSVNSIGSAAFSYCGLTGSLIIPDSVISIGSSAFSNCYGLTGSLTIPNSVISIGEWAFSNCNGFTGPVTIGNSVTSIGDRAFYNCYGLSGSLTIGNAVNSIGSCAFYYCNNLSSMIVLSETPPTLGSNAFYQVSTNIPVYVLCESVEAYQLTTGWDVFSNIMGMCSSGTVSVVADPMEGGIVSGAGTYEGGTFCTIVATPNQGYCFANWTKNGSVVSNNSNYSFVVTGESVMTAHFVPDENIVFADANVKVICVENWDVNGDGELSYLEAAWVTNLEYVFTDNTEITSFEELQYFIGLSSISDHAFSGCSSLTGSLIIPNSVTSIDYNAFYNCSGLTGSLTIPNYVTWIGYSAFEGCSGFTGSLTIGNSVTSISDYAFYDCHGLTGSLTLPSSVTWIGDEVFFNCGGLDAVNYLGDIEQWCNITFLSNPLQYAHNLFIDNELVTDLVIPEAVTEIKPYAFAGATCLTSLVLPNTLSSIGNYAFYSCSSLAGSLTIPNSVTSIGNYAFYRCSGLTGGLTLPSSLTKIGDNAFFNCSGLTGSLTLPNSLTKIGNNAFYNCSGLTGSLTLPNSVTTIGNSAFSGCRGFVGNLTIPSSIAKIANSAFYYCSGLTSVKIPNSVTSIGGYAFYYCGGLTTLSIGNSVTSMGDCAFYGCTNLEAVTMLAEAPPTIQYSTFHNCPQSIPVMVSCGSLAAYQSASYWNEFTNIQEVCSQQTVMLSEGWNWFATNLDITFDDLKSALLTALPETSITIKGKSGSTKYIVRTHTWNGTLDWDITKMYKIDVPNACEITLEGTPINPADHPITIVNGPNWIGYPLTEGMTVTAAFANFGVVNGDVVKSKSGSSRYWNGSWRPNGLNTLEPGQGYILNSAATGERTLVFPSGAK